MTEKEDPCRVTVGPLVLSYPALHTPKASLNKTQDMQYSAEFWLLADNPHAAEIHKSLVTASQAACAEKQVPFNSHTMQPLKEIDPAKLPAGRSGWMFRANSKSRPELFVCRTKGHLVPAIETDLYPGCHVYATIRASFYSLQGENNVPVKGVKFYLNGVCKVGDGQRMGGGPVDAAETFSATDMQIMAFDAAPTPGFEGIPSTPAAPAPPWQQQAPAAAPPAGPGYVIPGWPSNAPSF